MGNLKRLVTLNLSHNRLTDISSQILNLRQLETLNLNGNVRSEIVTDFGKLLTYREQMEQTLERAEVAQERAEVLEQEAVGARKLQKLLKNRQRVQT